MRCSTGSSYGSSRLCSSRSWPRRDPCGGSSCSFAMGFLFFVLFFGFFGIRTSPLMSKRIEAAERGFSRCARQVQTSGQKLRPTRERIPSLPSRSPASGATRNNSSIQSGKRMASVSDTALINPSTSSTQILAGKRFRMGDAPASQTVPIGKRLCFAGGTKSSLSAAIASC